MTPFERLLAGEYPPDLSKRLVALNGPEKLAAVRARIDSLDRSPTDQLPFERRILGAIEKDLRSTAPRDFIAHNRDVFDLVGRIFANLDAIEKYARGITNDLPVQPKPSTGRARRTAIAGRNLLERKLRLAAFLHDTGKALEQSRHPILGWHVLLDLASVGKSDRQAREILLANLKLLNPATPEAEYRWLARIIRDHDKFGVISTGEASYVVLGSLIQYGGGGGRTSISQLRDTWLLNLADIGGTGPARPAANEERTLPPLLRTLKIRQSKFDALTSDWNLVCGTISGRPFSEALDGLRQISETPERTVTRVRRLLTERASSWFTLADYLTDDLVEDALETHFAPRDLLAFCRDLGMVAKLDYALQFWNELADYLYIKETLDGDISQKVLDELTGTKTSGPVDADAMRAYADYSADRDRSPWIGVIADLVRPSSGARIRKILVDRAVESAKEERIARKQADLLIAILRRVVVAYRGLIRGNSRVDTAAIGVGFSYLRSDDREKRLALYELLTGGGDGRERGLRWLIDEIASWDMLA